MTALYKVMSYKVTEIPLLVYIPVEAVHAYVLWVNKYVLL